MNWQIFSTIGYVSVGMWMSMPALWLFHMVMRKKWYLCHLAVVLGIAAYGLARVNSASYVDRIQVDRSEQIALEAKKIEEEQKRKEAERSEDVADIRFAEDSRQDYLDTGGMSEDDKAYYIDKPKKPGKDDEVPAWKRQKQKRVANEDKSLDAAIGGVAETEGANTEAFEEEAVEPIIMSTEDKDMANRLDGINLMLIRWLIGFGILFVLFDYLRRFHVYRNAYFPLPAPSALTRIFSPLPVIQERPQKPRRNMVEELKFIIRQGGTFLYLTNDPERAAAIPGAFSRLPMGLSQIEVLPVNFEGEAVSPAFVFDALWFGRCAFAASNSEEVECLLALFSRLLAERRKSHACTRHPVHIIWDLPEPVPEIFKRNIEILGPTTGFCLFVAGRDE